jgi:hypothetical protein
MTLKKNAADTIIHSLQGSFFLGLEEINTNCGKIMHVGTMDRGLTVLSNIGNYCQLCNLWYVKEILKLFVRLILYCGLDFVMTSSTTFVSPVWL